MASTWRPSQSSARATLWGAVGAAALGVSVAAWGARRVEPAVAEYGRLAGHAWTGSDVPKPSEAQLEPDAFAPPAFQAFEGEPLGASELAADEAGKQRRSPGKKPQPKASDAPRGLRVSAAAVLKLAQARAMPGASWVAARGKRPAGLELRGVQRLGLGLRDGDVLTHVAGTPVTSVPQVITLVLQQRAKHAPAIEGTCYRADSGFSLVVEMPYPKPREATPGPRLIEPPAPSGSERRFGPQAPGLVVGE